MNVYIITFPFSYHYFQGEFSHWLDNTPMLQTSWYKSSISLPQYESSFYAISTNSSSKAHNYIRVDVKRNQPSTNTKDNCTAAVTDPSADLRADFIWVIIPCNKSFEATFLCMNPIQAKPVNFHLALNPLNRTCEDGWIMLTRPYKCFLLLKVPDLFVSYAGIEYMCSMAGGSVLSTNTVKRPPMHRHTTESIRLRRMAIMTSGHRKMPPNWADDTTRLYDVFFGQPLLRSNFKSSLARLLYIAENGYSLPLKLISNVNDRCGIVVTSAISMSMQRQLSGKFQRGWGGKYRDCMAKIDNISAVMCETSTKSYIPSCGNHHFECADSSCILTLYVCDRIYDCFDGSDEADCAKGFDELILKTSFFLPCVLTETCEPLKTGLFVPIQAICDGVNYFNLTFPQAICKRNLHININMLAMQNSRSFGGQYDTNVYPLTVSRWLKRELYHLTLIEHNKTPSQNRSIYNHTSLVKYMVPCRWTGENITMEERCKISVHSTPCDYGSITLLCQYVICPGMFKCTNFYCIYMSAVCDGQPDCYHGEDEQFCANISCPGLLKCRGENRCVSEKEICDNHPDCILSSDDEIMCQTCAEGCVCNGYMAHCNTSQEALSYNKINKMKYIKGLIIKSSGAKLYLKHLNLHSLIYLNISFNNKNIDLKIKQYSNINLLFADFNHNRINSTQFLRHLMFSTVVVLYLENNLLTHFNVDDSKLQYLKVLYLNHNPLISLIINIEHMTRLVVLNLRYIQFHPGISLTFYSKTITNLEVYVTDSTICCMLSQNVKCVSTKVQSNCYGLIKNYALKYSFYLLVSLTLIFVLSIFVINVNVFRNIRTTFPTQIVIKTNRIFADGICSIYLLCIAISDIIGVDAIRFRISSLCILLNALSFISFEGCIVFKTFYTMCVMLKTLFPFKHQCRWLRFSGIICGIAWVALSVIYIASVVYRYSVNMIILDKLCSFAECQSNPMPNILPFLGTAINTLSLIAICVCCTIFFISLEHYNKVQVVKRPTLKIMYRLCRPLCMEVFLRSYILSRFGVQLFGSTNNQNTCFIIVIILLPINILLSTIFNLIG